MNMNTYPKNVVSIHAHPDDTEIFCAGTLKLLKDKGYKICIVTMSAGGMGGIGTTEAETIKQRKKEAKEAAEVIGASYYCLGGRDGYLYDTESLRIDTLDIIRKEEAGIVMTHLAQDYHGDHRTTANIVETAAMLATLPNAPVNQKPLEITPLLYHTAPLGSTDPLGQPIVKPHFFVDISDVIEAKMDMLGKHQSQIELMRIMHRMDDFFGEMKKANAAYGEQCGVPYAEAFWQHLGGGFQKDALIQEELNILTG